ncbi:MAG: ATPase, T2SS/T4P/T4SS family [Bdellovibrionales bacterium]
MPSRRLHELDFMDLYVRLDGETPAHFHQLGKKGQIIELDKDVPEEFREDAAQLAKVLRETFDGDEMGITYDSIRLRASKVTTASGQVWVAMRRIADQPPALDKLGFNPQLVPHLRDLGKRDGLIFLCGSTGQGKTTTSCSMLADFLDTYGGVAFSIEDPVEYDLEGRRGKSGFCYQIEIEEEQQWGEMLKRSLRWHPRYIFVGEIRTPDAANQLLRAATSGHLVITTMHAGSIEEALEGMLQLAEQAIGDRAPLLLAAGLTAIVHQQLSPLGLNSHFLITEPNNPGAPIRAVIRDKRIGQCRSYYDQQMALLMKSGRLFKEVGRSGL